MPGVAPGLASPTQQCTIPASAHNRSGAQARSVRMISTHASIRIPNDAVVAICRSDNVPHLSKPRAEGSPLSALVVTGSRPIEQGPERRAPLPTLKMVLPPSLLSSMCA